MFVVMCMFLIYLLMSLVESVFYTFFILGCANAGIIHFFLLYFPSMYIFADTSPQTLARCAEFLVHHKQFDKAVELFVMAKRFPQAIDMCLQHKVGA